MNTALRSRFVHISGKTVFEVFKHSLDVAIRNIENHPRGYLFRRLIEYGPHHPDEPKAPNSDGKTQLSDPECGSAVNFIIGLMVNRFKGDLAELLALEPCIDLIKQLKINKRLPSTISLYYGDTIKERRRKKITKDVQWANFVDGADLMFVEHTKKKQRLNIWGIGEVKSMPSSRNKIINQINNHYARIKGGILLKNIEYQPDKVECDSSRLIRIMVKASNWKVSREWHEEEIDGVKTMKTRNILIIQVILFFIVATVAFF